MSRKTAADRLASGPHLYDEGRETRDPRDREALILQRLQHQLQYVYDRLPFYRSLYDSHGLKPSDVQSLADFTAKVPVVTKKMLVEDQAAHPPFGSYLGVERDQLTRIHGSSGTMGTPTLYGVSHGDWARAADVSAMALWCAGVRPTDVMQVTFPFALFFGGWGVIQAAERLGAATIPTGSIVPTERQIDLLHALDCDVMVGTPSYLIHLATRSRELARDVRTSSVSLLIAGGEPGASVGSVRDTLKELWGDPVIIDASAGSTSEMFPFLANIGCLFAEGGVHLYQDENYTEVVEPGDPNRSVPNGSGGATVSTHLWRESQPMIRFWMGDEGVIDDSPCPCGRTYPRLPRGVFGRVDDMLLIRGANIYPSAVEAVVRAVDGTGPEFRIIVDRKGALDEMCVETEYAPGLPSDRLEPLQRELEDRMRLALQVRVPVTLVEPGTHETQTFKARRVVDRRPRA